MARYIAYKNGEYENIIEIEPEVVSEYEELTGLTLEPVIEEDESPDPATMEVALNELGVTTRE